ncbi:MAG: LPS export ABC transporter periplasmic protein LptC [Bacteroidota bacterium]
MNSKYFLFAFVILISLWACEDDPTKPLDVPKLEQPAFKFKEVVTWYSEEAQRKIHLEAPTQLIYQNEDIAYPEGMLITMYDDQGRLNTTLTADSGRHIKQTDLFEARGNVKVVNHQKEQTFTSESLYWNQRVEQIYTDDSLEIITPTERLTGIGMTSDERFEVYKIRRPLGTFLVKSQGQVPVQEPNSTKPERGPSFDSLMQRYKTQKNLEKAAVPKKKQPILQRNAPKTKNKDGIK